MSEVGTFICYQPKVFTKDHQQIIERANAIIQPYESSGMPLTVRQIYYQFVHRNWIRNRQSEYNRLIGILTDARMAGLVSWTAIEDRGRALMGYRTFDAPHHGLEALSDPNENDPWTYRMDLWADQDWHPEIWVEKQALEGVIGSIANKLRVDYFATKGYSSITETWRAGQRMAAAIRRGQRPVIFHLGDHDPSGIDMTRHVADTLATFVGMPVMVQRLALNRDQIDEYELPENPAKMSDSRAQAYVEEHGYSSWELDALEPEVVHRLIENAILAIRNEDRWEEAKSAELEDKELIAESAKAMARDMKGEEDD